ncbi:MAG: CDP-glycerol glycerophosphotransferase family protein, partial [Lachnospiraceae bacterium]|nr:CDP-glycerol glycerophosphotransferase family protein [Lachnospiraceae bacterium]
MIGSAVKKIGRRVRKFKKKLKLLRAKIRHVSLNSLYIRCLKNKPLRENAVLLESKGGLDMGGNIFYLLKELTSGSYKDFEIYLAVHRRKRQTFQDMFERYGIAGVQMIETNGRDYYRLLATAKYLFNDTTFPAWFIKREGQVYLNTWHGTPFKMMGRDVWNRAYAIGNVQRNFLLADYLLYPNDYMKEKMLSSYMLNNLWRGAAMLEGYPRNSIFFRPERGRQVKEELGLADKRLILYMPTWRGVMTNKKSDVQMEAAYCYFTLLDELLTDDEIFFVKFHIFTAKKFKFEEYRHIRPFPEEFETYDFLNAADVLVTDYSSVFYDFANSGKKIVLFTYDRDEYLDERGLYVPIDSLPFPQASNAEELIREIRSPKAYDDTEFRSVYCKYDNADAARRILCHVLKGVNCCLTEGPTPNGKENVVIYCANLGRNGITTSL